MVNSDGKEEPEDVFCQKITVADRDLYTVPEDLKGFLGQNQVDITNLRQLKICGTGLTAVPASLGLLTSLFSLELVDNKLSDLPEELAQLHVKRFAVAGNLLVALPACFYLGLRHVLDLDISRNMVKSIETPPLCAARLRSLDFSCNSMTALPNWLSTSCGSLSSLSAGRNGSLCGVAGGAVLRAPLRNLDLTACAIAELSFLAATRTLVRFCIGNGVVARNSPGNCFWDFPEVILQSAASLLELSMRATCLSQLPPNIGMLRWLERLDLRDCELHTLPTEVGQLASLHSLLLSNNKLVSLPDSVTGLQGLRELRVDKNQIEVLPEGLGKLWGLVLLDLYDNRLDLWDDGWLNSLSSLQALDVELNQCSVEPSERYEELRSCLRLRLNSSHRSLGRKSGEESYFEDYDSDDCGYSDDLSDDCGPLEMPRTEPRNPESNWGSDDHSVSDSDWSPPEKFTTGCLQRGYMLWPPPLFPQKTFVQPNREISEGQFTEAMED